MSTKTSSHFFCVLTLKLVFTREKRQCLSHPPNQCCAPGQMPPYSTQDFYLVGFSRMFCFLINTGSAHLFSHVLPVFSNRCLYHLLFPATQRPAEISSQCPIPSRHCPRFSDSLSQNKWRDLRGRYPLLISGLCTHTGTHKCA